ncbi:hypothetical protein GCM10011514_11030 [Emticicia aquatilis]|uniref:Uncharacterized protein n=2 Tax=Emticicia aquatilis TaxID=1537369 RepID=A0A917DM62_9BACT|nr:hypothetical protein GCM10011514_11030 [Emticicia aquatilis]
MVIIYAVEVTILAILGYFRPVPRKSYWFVAIGVSVLILKDILYSYYFYVFKGNQHSLYIPLYWSNAIGYFLVIYGIAINQNANNGKYEKISIKAIVEASKNVFKTLRNEIVNFSITRSIYRCKTPI